MVHYTEFNAITSDFLREKLSKDHPLYHITVGQFDEPLSRCRLRPGGKDE